MRPALSPLVALALTAGLVQAQEIDLSGHWAVKATSTHRPGSAQFFAQQGGQHARYRVELMTHVGTELRHLELDGVWDGSKLVLFKAGEGSDAGFVSAIGGGPGSGPAASVKSVTYELRTPPPLDLERLVRVAGTLGPMVRLPQELHRTNGPNVRAPAEWEQAEEILWGYRDEFAVSRIYATAIKATLDEDVNHWMYVSSNAARAELEYELAEAAVPMTRVRFSPKKFQTVWMRDFGPITLKRDNGQRVVGDMGYFSDRPKDDFVPAQYAKARNWQRRDVESLKLEGGNYMSDGKGRVFTTSKALEDNPSQDHVEDRLRDLGAREVLFFERMPEPEGTGHIDMFAKLMDERTVLVGRCESPAKFKAVLDRNAERFQRLGYDVIRLDMASGQKLMTYTNSLLVGKTVLVPTYKNEALDAAALQVYRELGWNPVGIDSRSVIAANGAIHCISMQIPR